MLTRLEYGDLYTIFALRWSIDPNKSAAGGDLEQTYVLDATIWTSLPK